MLKIMNPLADAEMPAWKAERFAAEFAKAEADLAGYLYYTTHEPHARESISNFVGKITTAVLAAGFGCLPVKVKTGKSEASRFVSVVVRKGPGADALQATSSFYVPASSLVAGTFLPAWLVEKKLDEVTKRAPYQKQKYDRIPVSLPVWPARETYLRECLVELLSAWRDILCSPQETRSFKEKEAMRASKKADAALKQLDEQRDCAVKAAREKRRLAEEESRLAEEEHRLAEQNEQKTLAADFGRKRERELEAQAKVSAIPEAQLIAVAGTLSFAVDTNPPAPKQKKVVDVLDFNGERLRIYANIDLYKPAQRLVFALGAGNSARVAVLRDDEMAPAGLSG